MQRLPALTKISPEINFVDLQVHHGCSQGGYLGHSCKLLLWFWCRSFRRAAAAGVELKPGVVDQLLKVLSAGASLSFGAPY